MLLKLILRWAAGSFDVCKEPVEKKEEIPSKILHKEAGSLGKLLPRSYRLN